MPAAPVVPPDDSAGSTRPLEGRRARLPGVDAMRGLAAFGVVMIHAGLVVGNAVTPAAQGVSDFLSAWVVPFFLAAAFFFAASGGGSGNRAESFSRWLGRNAARLLVPYALWAVLYSAAKTVKFLLRHDPARAWEPWRDPAQLLLTGGGAVALYFLPLLFAGLVVGRLLGPIPHRLPLVALSGLAVGATVAAEVLAGSGNGFNLVTGRAFSPWLGESGLAGAAPVRIGLVFVAEVLRCLPFVLLAAVLARVLPALATRWPVNYLRVAGTAVFVGSTLLPFALAGRAGRWPEVIPGFGALILAWAFSLGTWPAGAARTAARLGAWSFGIFLAHQLALEALQLALGARFPTPAGPGTLLVVSLVGFGLCAAGIRVAERSGGRPLRRLFALPD